MSRRPVAVVAEPVGGGGRDAAPRAARRLGCELRERSPSPPRAPRSGRSRPRSRPPATAPGDRPVRALGVAGGGEADQVGELAHRLGVAERGEPLDARARRGSRPRAAPGRGRGRRAGAARRSAAGSPRGPPRRRSAYSAGLRRGARARGGERAQGRLAGRLDHVRGDHRVARRAAAAARLARARSPTALTPSASCERLGGGLERCARSPPRRGRARRTRPRTATAAGRRRARASRGRSGRGRRVSQAEAAAKSRDRLGAEEEGHEAGRVGDAAAGGPRRASRRPPARRSVSSPRRA